jgi:hypothetical protein
LTIVCFGFGFLHIRALEFFKLALAFSSRAGFADKRQMFMPSSI